MLKIKDMENIQIFNYKENPIQFDVVNGQVMANATSMCKAFSKKPIDWLNLKRTKDYIGAIVRKNHISDYQLVMTNSGNPESGGGSWVHEKLILSLARWLNLDFEIWCDEKIAELLKNGTTSIQSLPNFSNPAIAARAWAEQYEKREVAEKKIVKLEPAAKYAKEAMLSKDCMTITTIAKGLGMTAAELNQRLKEKGIQYFQDGHWVLKAKHQNKGYTEPRTHSYFEGNQIRTKHIMVWTEKGRVFIYNEITDLFDEIKIQTS